MKTIIALMVCAIFLTSIGLHAEERKSLTPDEQTAFLAKRIISGGMIGTFNGYHSP